MSLAGATRVSGERTAAADTPEPAPWKAAAFRALDVTEMRRLRRARETEEAGR